MTSNYPQLVVYNGHETYLANDLKQFFPNLFRGLRSVKGIVNKYSIPDDQHFVVKSIKESYEESNLSYLRSKILIKTGFIDNLLAEPEKLNPDEPRDAPPILELREYEKFTDDERNVYEVEVRGERHEDKIRFKGKDVERVFQMENLLDDVQRPDSGYKKNEDQERDEEYQEEISMLKYDKLEYRTHLSQKNELIKEITRKLGKYSRQLQENPGDPTISEKISKYRRKVMRLAGINENELVEQMENMSI